MQWLKNWWTFDPERDFDRDDNPHGPIRDDQRRNALPLLTMAFGWGFLITGLIVGGSLGNGLPFKQIIWTSFVGNFINFVLGALVGYIGYRTAKNSSLLYRTTYGSLGSKFPVLLVALLTICWQGIIVGAFGFAWTQSFDGGAFYAVAIFAGLLFTVTTYFGIKGLEAVSIPATIILILVGLYAGYSNVAEAGGWNAFLSLSEQASKGAPLTQIQAINLVIGSWIVGAIVMPEYTRFARQAWVAIAIPFIVMIVAQWFLQIVGAMGGIVSGTHDFTTYMIAQGAVIGGIGVVAMSFALWTTGDANLYLPSVQTASAFRRPQRVTTAICGILGTILGLGIYQHFIEAIDLLAAIAPPLIGPLLVDFYITARSKFDEENEIRTATWNPAAFAAYFIGAASTFFTPEYLPNALTGLFISILAYIALAPILSPKLTHAQDSR